MFLMILGFLLLFSQDCFTQSEYPNIMQSIKISRNKLMIKPHAGLKKYLRSSYFFVEYDYPEIDLNNIDPSILSIPFITTLIPLIWVSGQTYSIDQMDSDLFYALKEIKKIFKRFYPSLSWSGELIPHTLKKNLILNKNAKIGVLFSGGLDAIASSFNHIERDQLLITICGSDIKFYEQNLWNSIKTQTINFAQKYNKSYGFIRSNFTRIADGRILKNLSKLPQWWALTSQALHYTGLTAPLLYYYGIQHLVIGSSHTADLPMPYGSHPLIDNAMSFADISVYHDLGNLDRPQKIKLICKQCKKYKFEYPRLRVCWGNDKAGGNCCACEKCLRTINELIVVDKNPQKFGFAIDKKTAIIATQGFFSPGRTLKARQLWHWDCIQQYLKQSKMDYKPFIADHCLWLLNLNLEDFAKNNFELNSWKKQDQELARLWNESIKKSIPNTYYANFQITV